MRSLLAVALAGLLGSASPGHAGRACVPFGPANVEHLYECASQMEARVQMLSEILRNVCVSLYEHHTEREALAAEVQALRSELKLPPRAPARTNHFDACRGL